LIALNVLSNAFDDGAALSVDGANPSIARGIHHGVGRMILGVI